MKIIILASLSLLMSGCTIFSNDYSCGTIPESECTPVSDVYEKTSGNYQDHRRSSNSERKKPKKVVVNISTSNSALNYVSPGDPLLSKPLVMRVLYRSYENDKHDLDAGGYTFLRMKESGWIVER